VPFEVEVLVPEDLPDPVEDVLGRELELRQSAPAGSWKVNPMAVATMRTSSSRRFSIRLATTKMRAIPPPTAAMVAMIVDSMAQPNCASSMRATRSS